VSPRRREPVRAAAAVGLIAAALSIASCSGVGISGSSGGLGVGVATSPGDYFVKGRVTTAQPVALPDDAVIRVSVADVSQVDSPSEILGGVEFTVNGQQVPIPFEVRVPKQRVERRASIVVEARIEDEAGNLLFITDTQTPVITNGAPTEVDLVLMPVSPTAHPQE
jgi:putative lipoprotein